MITYCKECGHAAEWHALDGCAFDLDNAHRCTCKKTSSDVYIDRIRELEAEKDKEGTIYDEVSINRVMNYYLKDYKDSAGLVILAREYFIDTHKETVIFRLRVKKAEK